MNEKNNCIVIIFVFLIGIILGVVIFDRFSNSEVDRLSTAISDGQEINRRLQISNSYLSTINKRLTDTVGELEERIIADNKQYQDRLTTISKGLGTISDGLNATGETIQSIIDGMEAIKIELREIEKAK